MRDGLEARRGGVPGDGDNFFSFPISFPGELKFLAEVTFPLVYCFFSGLRAGGCSTLEKRKAETAHPLGFRAAWGAAMSAQPRAA